LIPGHRRKAEKLDKVVNLARRHAGIFGVSAKRWKFTYRVHVPPGDCYAVNIYGKHIVPSTRMSQKHADLKPLGPIPLKYIEQLVKRRPKGVVGRPDVALARGHGLRREWPVFSFRSRTPGPSPFSSTKITPADSRAACIER